MWPRHETGREIFDYGRSRLREDRQMRRSTHEDLLAGMVSYLRGARVVVRAVCDCECWCAAVRNCLQCGELGGGGEWTWLVYGRERSLEASLVYLNDRARSATRGVRCGVLVVRLWVDLDGSGSDRPARDESAAKAEAI